MEMRKRIVFIGLFLIVFLLAACGGKYDDWQTVGIHQNATIKVPKEWVITREDNVLYMTDKPMDDEDYKIFLIGTIWGGNDYYLPSDFLKIEYINPEFGEVNSLGVMYGMENYNINGDIVGKYFINFNEQDHGGTEFLAWDDLLDYSMIKKIAESYNCSM